MNESGPSTWNRATLCEYLGALVRDIHDFPKPGVLFKDITPLLGNARALGMAERGLAEPFFGEKVDTVVGIESRGFIFGPMVAIRLNAGFVPARKPGKLPAEVDSVSYSLEYGTNTLQIHRDAIRPGSRVLIVDDLLATGGTAAAAAELVRKQGGEMVGFSFLVELAFLGGRRALGDSTVRSLLVYAAEG